LPTDQCCSSFEDGDFAKHEQNPKKRRIHVARKINLQQSKSQILKGQKDEDYLNQLVRPNILDLDTPEWLEQEICSDPKILLGENENSFGSCLLGDDHLELHRYPDPNMRQLKCLLADFRGCRPEEIFLTPGSRTMDWVIRVFCCPGGVDNIITTPPTYGMYKVLALTNDVPIREAPLTPDFDVDVPKVLATVTETTKIIFICSPGNPTGKAVPVQVIRDIFEGGYRGIIVWDEAYVDYMSEGENKESAVSYLDEFPRLIILQTFSKGFGLAGTRLAYSIASAKITRQMDKCRSPYNINKLSAQAAITALSNLEYYHENVAEIKKQRKILMDKLKSLEFVRKVHESDANFILLQVEHAEKLYVEMAENGCVTRFRGKELYCTDCLRVTVGNAAENEGFLKIFEQCYYRIERQCNA